MGKVVCSCCGDYVDGKAVRICNDCDTVICGKCSAANHNFCTECFGDMGYVN